MTRALQLNGSVEMMSGYSAGITRQKTLQRFDALNVTGLLTNLLQFSRFI